ncbi:MAG: hypothetical protein QW275_01400 [Candidatus Anstonellaceae archaeon]
MAGKKKALEDGICILCGVEKKGYPAKMDFPIRTARKIRELLRLPPRHTIACESCFGMCEEKRRLFEKMVSRYSIYSILFSLMVIAGGIFYSKLELWLLIPAILGSAIMLLLPYGRYFPKFQT